MKSRFPHSVYNWISLVGATIAIIALFMIIFLFSISALFNQGGSYLGLIIYILLPSVMVMGLLLIPIGMWRVHRKEKKTGKREPDEWPKVDLNIERHRNAFITFVVGTTIFLFLSAIGSYEAFEYTESTEFCGTLCHEVMNPEYVAYNTSPHARVRCVECHVGSGVDWYIRSKLSGLRQVYGVLTDDFNRPIETPIQNLRPARETCENCHWPEKFYPHKIRTEKYFLADEENTEWDVDIVIKVGSTLESKALDEGVHWHINPDVVVEYAATDNERQDIVWVKYVNQKTGETYKYTEYGEELEEGMLDSLEIRKMDCMDCHNRPSHNYKSPSTFINGLLASGDIPKFLPEIKYVALDALSGEYSTADSAKISITQKVKNYYTENYEGEYSDVVIDKAVEGIIKGFSRNIFPEMKVKWSEYPNNIGHIEYKGCFRCHNDQLMTPNERVVERDCNQCHLIIAQGSPDSLQRATMDKGLEFKHPVDIDLAWQDMNCNECHTGGGM